MAVWDRRRISVFHKQASHRLRSRIHKFDPCKNSERIWILHFRYLCSCLPYISKCTLGTCMPSRLGFPLEIVWGANEKPQRGQYNIAVNKNDPDIVASAWKDNGKVYFLSSGQSHTPSIVQRRKRTGPEVMDVPCPEFVHLYNKYMNGADVHDQKRLQRFSIQMHVRYKKYYKSIAMGLVDVALVNAYVLHVESSSKVFIYTKTILLFEI